MADMEDNANADCTARRPLALKLAEVDKPCSLVARKTGLMEGVGDTHGLRPRRRGGVVDWPVRMSRRLEYYNHGILQSGPTAGSWPYSRGMSNPTWDGASVLVLWMGACGPKQNLGGM